MLLWTHIFLVIWRCEEVPGVESSRLVVPRTQRTFDYHLVVLDVATLEGPDSYLKNMVVFQTRALHGAGQLLEACPSDVQYHSALH